MTFPSFKILSILLLTCSVTAVDFLDWSSPWGTDVRSPCPGLNALANHGILPRTGKNVTIPILVAALKSGLNVGADFSTALGTAALDLVSPDPQNGSFDLNQLSKHNLIEHDSSLSRNDYYISPDNDNYDFNQTIFDQVLSFFDGVEETSIEVAAKAKYARLLNDQVVDKNMTYGAKQFVLSYGESALYLSTMGDPVTGVAPLEFVKVLFEQERLPYLEGWRPTTNETNLASLGTMLTALYTASGEPVPDGIDDILGLF